MTSVGVWRGCGRGEGGGRWEAFQGGEEQRASLGQTGMGGIGSEAGTRHFARSKLHSLGSIDQPGLFWSPQLCSTSWAGTNPSRYIGAASVLPWVREKFSLCPTVVPQQLQTSTKHSTGQLTYLFQCNLRYWWIEYMKGNFRYQINTWYNCRMSKVT